MGITYLRILACSFPSMTMCRGVKSCAPTSYEWQKGPRIVKHVIPKRIQRGLPLSHAAPAPGLSTLRQAQSIAGSRTSPLSSLSLSKRTPRSLRPSHPTPGPLTMKILLYVIPNRFVAVGATHASPSPIGGAPARPVRFLERVAVRTSPTEAMLRARDPPPGSRPGQALALSRRSLSLSKRGEGIGRRGSEG